MKDCTDELKEITSLLEESGMDVTPMVEVPYFSAGVVCGKPSEIGDQTDETFWIPQDLLKRDCNFVIRATGDSMIGANIFDGDKLAVRAGADAKSGDIVVAYIDGLSTIKAYFEDEDNNRWLVPQNENYEPIRIDDNMDVRILGVVLSILHEMPRVEYKACMKAVRGVKKNSDKVITETMIQRAIKEVLPLIQSNRQWFSVYRVLVDRGYINDEDFSVFVSLINNLMKDEAPKLYPDDLRKMSVDCFRKPFVLWTPENAPIRDKRFFDYLKIAKKFNMALR